MDTREYASRLRAAADALDFDSERPIDSAEQQVLDVLNGMQPVTDLRSAAAGRHPGVQDLARFFDYRHLPPHLQVPSFHCSELAARMLENLEDSAELTAGLRKLLEAKDCFVRASLP